MKKLLLICGMLWATVASAQFVPGQVLTAAELNNAFAQYAPLTGATFTGPVAVGNLSASGTVSGAGFSNLLSPYLTSSTAASTYAPITGSANYAPATGSAVYAPIASPTFTGTVTIPSGASISGFAPLASPTFTGTPTVPGYLTTASAVSTYAPIASPTFTGTVSTAAITATGAITPATTAGIVGTTAANNANTGSIGEFAVANGSAIPLTTSTATNVTSLTLTAGDWDVNGSVLIQAASSTIISNALAGVSGASATLPTAGNYWQFGIGPLAASATVSQTVPTLRINSATSFTVYLIAFSSFTVSTCTASGTIRARRVR